MGSEQRAGEYHGIIWELRILQAGVEYFMGNLFLDYDLDRHLETQKAYKNRCHLLVWGNINKIILL